MARTLDSVGRAVGLLGIVLACPLGAVAQIEVLCVDNDPPGQWSNAFGPLSPMQARDLGEIAHAFVLPPPTGLPNLQRVLFMCRLPCNDYVDDAWLSYVWSPRDPSEAEEIAMVDPDGAGTAFTPGTAEPFCGGEAFATDGDPVIVAGLNYKEKCDNPDPCIQNDPAGDDTNTPFGHKIVQRLDISVDPPVWMDDAIWPASLQLEHWYPLAITLFNGRLFVTGHTGAPNPLCLWPYGSMPSIDRRFEILDLATGVATVADNLRLPCGSTAQPYSTHNYGRMHLLSTGKVVHTNARDPEAPLGQQATTRYLDVLQPACGSELRWEQALASAIDPALLRRGGSSVHYVLQDPTTAGGLRDVFYTFGGIEMPAIDDDPCLDPDAISDSVQRLSDPDTDAAGYRDWTDADWEDMAPMPEPRVNHNAILLPTGGVLIPGGDTNGTPCGEILTTIEFQPPELFNGPDVGEWKNRGAQGRPRGYHSVGGLLPDGRPFSAGGDVPHLSYHTVEIYSPAYYFSGDRPTVSGVQDSADHGDVVSFSVTLRCSAPNHVKRVVLIKNSAATHAFDSSQRYVELAFAPFGSYPNITIDATIPTNDSAVPPGLYLLFVLDKNNLPSKGAWIKIV